MEPNMYTATHEYLTVYDSVLPENARTQKQIDSWLKKLEPIFEQKKNQQGVLTTKHRKERYAKNSRMYIKDGD